MIYVSDMMPCMPNRNWRWREACHMFCTGDLDELHAFAGRLGLRRAWFQADSAMPHYDLTRAKRRQAVRAGVIAANRRAEALWIRAWRQIRNMEQAGQTVDMIRRAMSEGG